MPDRFANGDPANDSPAGVSAVRRIAIAATRIHGGDLRGIRDHLGYLKDLGVTGIWMTPIYRNSTPRRTTPYHGYHTVDFYDVEPRFGTMAGVSRAGGRGPSRWASKWCRTRWRITAVRTIRGSPIRRRRRG